MSELVDQITPAKLEIPEYPPAYIERPILMRHMQHLLHQKMTCVLAPMGSGKTYALAEFARTIKALNSNEDKDGRKKNNEQTGGASIPKKVAWLTLDVRDANPSRFWLHVLAALASEEDSFINEAYDILSSSITYESIERFASTLFTHQSCANTLLILDSIDQVNNEMVESQLLHFIFYTPSKFRVFVSARRFSKVMESGSYQLGKVYLNYHDLLLTHTEAKRILEFTKQVEVEDDRGNSVSLIENSIDDDFQSVIELTEGWPQGVSLAEQTLVACVQRNYPYLFSGASNAVKRYFSSNAITYSSEHLMFTLKVLALFERFNKPLFKTVFAAYPEIRDRFNDLVSGDVALIIACDDQGEWYRFNHLFADWLQHNIHSDERHVIRRACLIASEWFNKEGHAAEAAKYLLMSVDFGYVSSIVEATSGQKCNVKDGDEFVWISHMPAASFYKSPLLSLLTAWSYNVIGRITDAESWLEVFRNVALESPKHTEQDTNYAIKLLEAKHFAMAGDTQHALKLNEELLDAEISQDYSLASMLYQSIGEANERLGRFKTAEEMFLQAQASASVDNTEHQLYFNMFSYAKIRFDLGDFDECESTCNKLLETCPDEFVFKDASYGLLALIHVERNMFDEAEEEVIKSLRNATPYQNVDMYLISKIAQSTLLAAKGELADAYETISEAVMHGEQNIVPKNALLSAYFKQSEIAEKRGNERDLQLIERKFKIHDDTSDDYHNIMYLMVQGACLRQQGNINDAALAYSQAVDKARELNASFFEAKALVELLINGDIGGSTNRGAILGRLIQLVDFHGFKRVLLDAGVPMRDLLRKYSSSSHVNVQTRQFVKGILVLFERELHTSKSIEDVQNMHIGKLDNLTAREREVLALLNMGMSRKEIADTLCVSINTAKKHLSNIYAKLGAQSRDQALDVIAAVDEAPNNGTSVSRG